MSECVHWRLLHKALGINAASQSSLYPTTSIPLGSTPDHSAVVSLNNNATTAGRGTSDWLSLDSIQLFSVTRDQWQCLVPDHAWSSIATLRMTWRFALGEFRATKSPECWRWKPEVSRNVDMGDVYLVQSSPLKSLRISATRWLRE